MSLLARRTRPGSRSRWRWLRRVLLGLLGAVAALVAALSVLVRQLDAPPVKRQVRALVRDFVGLDVDYGRTEVRLRSGLRVTDLVFLSPGRFRPQAPELLRLGSLEVAWSPRALLGGGAFLTRVDVRGLALTVVRDADGVLSFAELGKPAAPDRHQPKKQKPGPPPSRLAASLLAQAPPLLHAALDEVTLTLLILDERRMVERLRLDGLRLRLDATPVGRGWQLRLQTGPAAEPLTLKLRHERDADARDATVLLWLDATLAPTQAAAALELRIAHQTLMPTLTVDHLLSLGAEARFDEKAGRTDLSVRRMVAAGGAASLEASVELYDHPGRAPLLRLGRGAVELLPLLRVLPSALPPLRARRGQLRFDVGALPLAWPPQLLPGGHAHVAGELDAAHLALAGGELSLQDGAVELTAEPTAERGTSLRARLPLHGLRYGHGAQQVSGAALELTASGQLDASGAISGDATVRLGPLEHTTAAPAAQRIASAGGHLALHATEVRLELAAASPPHAQPAVAAPAPAVHSAGGKGHPPPRKRTVHGRLTVSGQLGGLLLARPELRVELDTVEVGAQARLAGGAPYGLDLNLPLGGLRIFSGDGQGRSLYAGPARLDARLADVYPDVSAWRQSRGEARLAVELGLLRMGLDLHKHPTRIDYELKLDAASLHDLGPILGTVGYEIPWERIALSLHSQGQADGLFSPQPRFEQRGELRLDRPSLSSTGGTIAAQSLLLGFTTGGTARAHTVDLDLHARGLNVRGDSLADVHLTAGAAYDSLAPSLRLRLASDAETGPQASLSAALTFDGGRQALGYDVSMKAAKLAALQPFLARLGAARGLDLAQLELTLAGKGRLLGVVAGIGPGASLRLTPRPLLTGGVDGTLSLSAAGLYYSVGDRVVKSPLLAFRMLFGHEVGSGLRKLHTETQVDALHIEFGDHELDFSKLGGATDVSTLGELGHGDLDLAQQLRLGGLEQDLLPGYSFADVSLSVRAQRNPDGELRIDELKLKNPGGGTTFDLQGHLDLGAGRRSLSLHGALEQQLERLWADRSVYVGRGSVSLQGTLDSGDLSLFHTEAAVLVRDGDVRLPRSGVSVEGFIGEVPIIADVLLGPRGLQVLPGVAPNLYSQIRYADQHPLLSGRSFITVRRFATPLFQVADLAGNLRITDNLVSLSQFELGLRGGHVSGQCLVDFRESGPMLHLRVRASRIDAAAGEPFDGNAAVVISGRDRSVEGRAEILRIGRRHLLSLLDLHDAQHSDPAVNRIRRALLLGYPDRLSLSFAHGFAQAEISFAGLARLVRVDPLRGIPMGPIVDKLLPPKAESEEEP